MSQRSYSYADPVLAGKLSGLADQFVNGPARAQQMQAERQRAEAQAQLANQQRLAGEAEMDGVRGVQHFFDLNDPNKVNHLMAQSYGAGDRGNDVGTLARAFMLNNPMSTDEQRLGAFAGAGGNVNADSAFSVAGQDRVSGRNAQESIAQLIAGINATPLTESQVKGQILGGMDPTAQQNVVGGNNLSAGQMRHNALGEMIAQAPFSPSQGGAGGSGGSGGSTSGKNWIDPLTGDGGITFDSVTDAATGRRLPEGAQLTGNAQAPGDSTPSPQDIGKSIENADYIRQALSKHVGEDMPPMPPEVHAAVMERASTLMQQGVLTHDAAVQIALHDFGVNYNEGDGFAKSALARVFGGEPSVSGWSANPGTMPQAPQQVAPMTQPLAQPELQPQSPQPMVQGVPTDTGGQQQTNEAELIAQAQNAVAQGVPVEAIIQRLQEMGVDMSQYPDAQMGIFR